MLNLFHQRCFAMYTRFEVVWWGIDRRSSDALFEAIQSLLSGIERHLNCHAPDSELYRLNQFAAERPVPVSEYLFDVLKTVADYHQKTCGCFDPDYQNRAPDKCLAALIQFDENSSSIRFQHPKTKLDLGAIGKGLALEKINNDILKNNVSHAFISFGESSIMTRGRHPNGDHWPVGVSDLFQPGKNLYTMRSTDHSISVSSTRRKNADETAGTYHVFDPGTGKIINQDKIVMVKSASPIEAEVLSTALLVANTNQQQQILKNFTAAEAIQIEYDHGSPKITRLI